MAGVSMEITQQRPRTAVKMQDFYVARAKGGGAQLTLAYRVRPLVRPKVMNLATECVKLAGIFQLLSSGS